jgi:hypothetical protein
LDCLSPARLSRALAGLVLVSAGEACAAFAEDVPFVTTPDRVTMEMLRLAGVGPGDYLIDLGSGDGRIVITAARHFGARALGVEIVPDLVRQSRENAARAGVAARAQFLQQDLFLTDLTPATAVTLYLLPEVNLQLRPRLLQLRPGTRIVSHDWDMGEWLPDRTLRLEVPEKKVGLAKSSLVHLWIVPARLAGAWCGERGQRGTQLTFDQQFQFVRGALSGAATGLEFTARIEGRRLATATGTADFLEMKLDGTHLGVVRARGAFSRLQGARFQRREGQVCE